MLSSGEIKQLVDPFLGNDYDCDEMERMTLAASLCTRTSSHSRPEMSLVRTWEELGVAIPSIKRKMDSVLHNSDPKHPAKPKPGPETPPGGRRDDRLGEGAGHRHLRRVRRGRHGGGP